MSQCLSEVLLVQFLLGPPEAPEPPESHRTHLHPSGLRGRVTEGSDRLLVKITDSLVAKLNLLVLVVQALLVSRHPLEFQVVPEDQGLL